MKNKRYFLYIILAALLLLIAIGFIMPQLNKPPTAAERQWLFRVELLDLLGTAYAEYLKQPGADPADKQKFYEFAQEHSPAWGFDRQWRSDFRNIYGTEKIAEAFNIIAPALSPGASWMLIESSHPGVLPLGITSDRKIFTVKELGSPENLNRHNMPKE